MATRGVTHVSNVLSRLRTREENEVTNLQSSQARYQELTSILEEEVHDDESPVFSEYSLGGPDAIRRMTNFTPVEFNVLWSYVENIVVSQWSQGRGRRHKTSAKDAFFMSLSVLKHYDTWYKHADDFNLNATTFQNMIEKVRRTYDVIQLLTIPLRQMFDIITPALYELFVKPPYMGSTRFDNFNFAKYALDVKFQNANRPNGTFMDAKRYFSGKHKLYGFKVECAVSPQGYAVYVSKHYPGSVNDKVICEQNISTHRKMLKKTSDEAAAQDFGEGATKFPDYWAILCDKGYQGIGEVIRAVHPKRQPPRSILSQDDLDRNKAISFDRVIVENFFGRVNMLWRIMYTKYTWSENRYDTHVKLCFALTNYHIRYQPLRVQDADYYRSTLARYVSMATDQVARKRQLAHESRNRRRVRLNIGTPFSSPNSTASQSSHGFAYEENSLSPSF